MKILRTKMKNYDKEVKVKRNSYQYVIYSKKGFTLLECVWSLLIMGFILWGVQANWQILNDTSIQMTQDCTADVHQFSLLLEKELSQYHLEQISSNKMVIRNKETEQKFTIQCNNQKIYKSPGHHPYLYGVEDWQLSLEGSLLWTSIQFTTGQSFEIPIILQINDDRNEAIIS